MTFIKEHYDLQALNTLATRSSSRYFANINNIGELLQAFNFSQQKELEILVLGGGSNLIFKKDWEGITLFNSIKGIEVIKENTDEVELKVGAGENWHNFVLYTLNHNWFGLENLALIPGTVGAGPVQNIGAYGLEIKDFVISLEVFDLTNGKIKTFLNKDCNFSYRKSIFQDYGKFYITSVNFKLTKFANKILSYPSLISYLQQNNHDINKITPQEICDAVIQIRNSKLPNPQYLPNVGSFFKNPIIDNKLHQKLKSSFPNLIAFKNDNNWKIAAGWLIDQCGLKGFKDNGIAIYEQNALVIVNPAKKSGKEIIDFAKLIQDKVQKKFSIDLEIEPRVI